MKIEIKTIPTQGQLCELLHAVNECLKHYDGNNTLLYDHLENQICKVLNVPVTNPELEVE